MKRIDLTGRLFGRLTVKEFSHTKNEESFWLCECSCGKSKTINGNSLKRGRSKSCGCGEAENRANRVRLNTTHGHSAKNGTNTYHVWNHIKARCTNSSNPFYYRYGGRGITICDRWLNSFENFLEDMGECPKGMSIDRINNDLGYFKENCGWRSPKEQSRNRSSNIKLTFNGKTQCLLDWATELGFNYKTLLTRHRSGWSPEKILTTPLRGWSKGKPKCPE